MQVSLNVAHDDLDESVSARKLAEASARNSAQQADALRVQVRDLKGPRLYQDSEVGSCCTGIVAGSAGRALDLYMSRCTLQDLHDASNVCSPKAQVFYCCKDGRPVHAILPWTTSYIILPTIQLVMELVVTVIYSCLAGTTLDVPNTAVQALYCTNLVRNNCR